MGTKAYKVWATLVVIAHRATGEEIIQENLDPAQRLLLDVRTWMPRARIDLELTPCGGRCLPWPTVINTREPMSNLIDKGHPGEKEPHLTKIAEEGAPVTIPSGVGEWARALEASWTHNGRLWWQHQPSLPDYTDHRVENRFSIDRNVDLVLEKATTRDSGTYIARFKLQADGPLYVMTTNLTVYRHPQPRILGQKTRNARRLTLNATVTTMELGCDMVRSHPDVVLNWERDSETIPEAEIQREQKTTTETVTLKVTRADNGSLLTCVTSNKVTQARKTATISVKALGSETQGQERPRAGGIDRDHMSRDKGREADAFLGAFLKEFRPPEKATSEGPPTSAELGRERKEGLLGTTTEKLTLYAMAAIALSAATIGTTLSIISKCQNRSRGASYHLTRTYTTQ